MDFEWGEPHAKADTPAEGIAIPSDSPMTNPACPFGAGGIYYEGSGGIIPPAGFGTESHD